MVVDGDEEEEVAHVYPITCAELLSGDTTRFHSFTEELFHRFVIHSSSVIFLLTTSPMETFCRLSFRR
jgi:hypothetical protein